MSPWVEGWGVWVRVRHSFLVDAKLSETEAKNLFVEVKQRGLFCLFCFEAKQQISWETKRKQSETNVNKAKKESK